MYSGTLVLATVLLYGAGSVTGVNKHFICKEVSDIFEGGHEHADAGHPHTQGPPGKRGVKGEVGAPGLRGPPGHVDYERILATLKAEVEPSTCEVTYNGKCFWLARLGDPCVFTQIRAMCAEKNGVPANLYGEVHYLMVADLLRAVMSESETVLTIWLGMTFDQSTRTVVTSHGDVTHFRKTWYPGHPHRASNWTRMGIHVDKDPDATQQGIHTWPTTLDRHGVLCEKE